MTQALYMKDSYLKEFDAKVVTANGKYIVLDRTAFYPRGGGVEWDTGVMKRGDDEFKVIFTGKFKGDISHEVDKEGLKEGDEVHCTLDWDRRYRLMRYHTATHVLSGVLFKEYDLQVTGNQLTTQKGRVDLNMDELDTDLLNEAIQKSNDIIDRDLPVKIYSVTRKEAEANPDLFKLAMGFPHDIDTIRIVEIVGFDAQADGGCHVKSLKEAGHIIYEDAKNKGKDNKRVYFTLEE